MACSETSSPLLECFDNDDAAGCDRLLSGTSRGTSTGRP
jgi:hypothetical protein